MYNCEDNDKIVKTVFLVSFHLQEKKKKMGAKTIQANGKGTRGGKDVKNKKAIRKERKPGYPKDTLKCY